MSRPSPRIGSRRCSRSQASAQAASRTAIDDSLDGVSLLPVLRADDARIERSLYFHYPHYIAGYRHDPARETWWNTPGAAVRSGALKLVRRFDGATELYDLASDPGEAHDLAADRPADVRRLEDDLGALARIAKARTCRGRTPPTTPAPSLAASPTRWRLWATLRSGRPTAAARSASPAASSSSIASKRRSS